MSESASVLSDFRFVLVPKGLSGTTLKLGVRVLPVLSDRFRAVTSLDALPGAAVPDKGAILDWPRFLSEGLAASVQLRCATAKNAICGAELGQAEPLADIQLDQWWSAALRRLQLDVGQASDLWRAVFADCAAIAPQNTALTAPDPSEEPFDHQTVARGVSMAYGNAAVKTVSAPAAPSSVGPACTGIVECGPLAIGQEVRDLTRIFAPPGAPDASSAGIIASGLSQGVASVGAGADSVVVAAALEALLPDEPGTTKGPGTDAPRVHFPLSSDSFRALTGRDRIASAPGEAAAAAAPQPMGEFGRAVLRKIAETIAPAKCSEERMYRAELHQILGSLQNHPALLRRLGLAFDVDVEVRAKDPDALAKMLAAGDAFVAFSALRRGAAEIPLRQRFFSALNAGGAPRPSAQFAALYVGGVVNLNVEVSPGRPRFSIEQIDVDGSTDKLLNTATGVMQRELAGAPAEARTPTLYAQRTVGMSLTDRGMHAQLTAKTVDVCKNLGNNVRCLYEEDLVVGFCPDVRRHVVHGSARSTGAWRSLVSRSVGRAAIARRRVTGWFPEADDAPIAHTFREVTAATGGGGEKTAVVPQQELFRWDGWSLAVSQPRAGAKERANLGALELEYRVTPGSLEKQRFDSEYEFGARLAYADGSVMPLTCDMPAYGKCAVASSVASTCGNAARFYRYEPVEAPDIHLAERLDLRRFPHQRKKRIVVASGLRGHKQSSSSRVVVPRPVSAEIAIRHGQFDDKNARARKLRGAFRGVCLLPCGTFPTSENAMVCDAPAAGPSAAPGEDTIYVRRWGAPAPELPYLPDPQARQLIIAFYRLADDRFWCSEVHDYYDAQHPWPDCQALHLDVIAAESVHDQERGFDVEKTRDRITVKVAAAEQIRVRLWHSVDRNVLLCSGVADQVTVYFAELARDKGRRAEHMAELAAFNISVASGSSRLLPPQSSRGSLTLDAERLTPDAQARLKSHVADYFLQPDPAMSAVSAAGIKAEDSAAVKSFWMLNAHETLDIVHAVDTARESARFASVCNVGQPCSSQADPRPLRLLRQKGKVGAQLLGHIMFDRKSTGRVSAVAAWTDNAPRPRARIDGKSAPFFVVQNIETVADERGCAAPPGGVLKQAADRQLLEALTARGDPRAFPDPLCVGPGSDGPQSEVVFAPGENETHARVLSVSTAAESRFSGEFAGDVTPAVRSRAVRVEYRSSERPRPVEVDWIVELSVASTRRAGDTLTTTLQPGWFRIWLKGGWYSSGNGELLALVGWPGTLFESGSLDETQLFKELENSDTAKPVEPYITRWGLDPLRYQDPDRVPFGLVTREAFKNRLTSWQDADKRYGGGRGGAHRAVDLDHWSAVQNWSPSVRLDEILTASGQPSAGANKYAACALALYAPEYDDATERWYVDIQIDPQKTYFPFLRPALARYQPLAEPGLELSQVTNSEWVQLSPEREITTHVSLDQARIRRKNVRLRIAGAAPEGGRHPANCVHVRLERQPAIIRPGVEHGVEYDTAGVPSGYWIPHEATDDKDEWRWDFDPLHGFDHTFTLDTLAHHSYSLWIEEREGFNSRPGPDRMRFQWRHVFA